MLKKPASVENDPFKSAKWDELTDGRKYTQADTSALALLVQWHAVAQRCMEDIDDADGMVAYQNDMGDLKALPQIAIMKQASAEIRALNKQLGIRDEVPQQSQTKEVPLHVIQFRRQARAAGA